MVRTTSTLKAGALALLSFAMFPKAVFASPTVYGTAPAGEIQKRDTPVHCVDDPVDGPSTTGNLLCLDLGGIPPGKRDSLGPRDAQGRMTCDECLGLNGNDPAVTEDEVTICYITLGDPDTYGNQTSCPGDPAPTTNPDGSDGATVATGIMDTYCAVAGTDGLFGWATFGACYAYTFAQNGNSLESNEAGVNLLCDTFFAGLCTAMEAIN